MVATYRATRNEPRVGVGEWTGDFFIHQIYTAVLAEYEYDGEGNVVLNPDGSEKLVYPRTPNGVPDYICDYLVSHGILVDSRVDTTAAESPAPPTGPTRPTAMATVTPLDNGEDNE